MLSYHQIPGISDCQATRFHWNLLIFSSRHGWSNRGRPLAYPNNFLSHQFDLRYNSRLLRSIYHEFCLIRDFLSVRLKRTELGATWLFSYSHTLISSLSNTSRARKTIFPGVLQGTDPYNVQKPRWYQSMKDFIWWPTRTMSRSLELRDNDDSSWCGQTFSILPVLYGQWESLRDSIHCSTTS